MLAFSSKGHKYPAMKARIWQIPKAGSLARLRLTEMELSTPQSKELLVELRAVGLNFADIFACQGLYSATPRGAFVPGLEFSGIVREAGPSSSYQPGDFVMGLVRFGAYASHLVVSEEYIRPLPPDWDFAGGAAYLTQALTAWYAIHTLGAIETERDSVVLLHSAAGGVGLWALRILQKTEARVLASIGSESKRGFLLKQGLVSEQIIVRHPRRFAGDLDAALAFLHSQKLSSSKKAFHTSQRGGLDLVLDAVAGRYFFPAFERLNPAGRHILFGSAGFMNQSNRPSYLRLALEYLRRPKLDPLSMISENRALLAFNLIWLWGETNKLSRLIDAMRAAGLENEAPFVGHRFSFAQAPEAMRFFQSGKTIGKVVLEL